MTPHLELVPPDPASGGAAGSELNVFRALGVVPLIRDQVYRLGGRLLVGGNLPGREREILVIRVAALIGSEYELAQHVRLGRDAGLTEVEVEWCIQAVDPRWVDDDRNLIALADELHETGTVRPSLLASLSRRWTSAELVEMVFVVGFYRMVGGFLSTFDVPLDPGVTAWQPHTPGATST